MVAIPLHVVLGQTVSAYAPLAGLSDITGDINTILGHIHTDLETNVYSNVQVALNLPTGVFVPGDVVSPTFVAPIGNYCYTLDAGVGLVGCYLDAPHTGCNSIDFGTGAITSPDLANCAFSNP